MYAQNAVNLLNNYLGDDDSPPDPALGRTMTPEEFRAKFGNAGSSLGSDDDEYYFPPKANVTAPPDVVVDAIPVTSTPVSVSTNVVPTSGAIYDPVGHPLMEGHNYQVVERTGYTTPSGVVEQQTTTTTKPLPGERTYRNQYIVNRDAPVIPSHSLTAGNPLPEAMVTHAITPPTGLAGLGINLPKGAGVGLGIAGALGAAALINNYFQSRKAEEEKQQAAAALANDPNAIV